MRGSVLTFTVTHPALVDSEQTSEITEHDATLEAQIQTNGSYTGYEFQLYTIANGNYNFTPNCPFDIPGYGFCEEYVKTPPPGLVESQSQYIPEGSGDQAVSLDLASIEATLEPGSTYHYRLLAADTSEIVPGPVQEFTTTSGSRAHPLGREEPPASGGPVTPESSTSIGTGSGTPLPLEKTAKTARPRVPLREPAAPAPPAANMV
jgi:hypothetical protein